MIFMSNQVISCNNEPVDAELNVQQPAIEQEEQIALRADTRRGERYLAFYLLYAIDRSDYQVSLDEVAQVFSQEYEVTLPEDKFYQELCDGAIEKRDELDTELKPFLKNWRVERLGCCTRLILRLALWEMLFKKTPALVVINEAVELAKSFAEKDAFKFVNGVLDEIAKRFIQEKSPLASS